MAMHRAKSKANFFAPAFVAVFSLIAALLVGTQPSQAVTNDISMYISAPYVQGSHVSGSDVRSESFNSLSSCTGATAVGNVSRVQTNATAICTVKNGDTYGGAAVDPLVSTPTRSGTLSKYMWNGYDEVTFDLTEPVKYVGLWWSGGNDSNTITFFDGLTQLASLDAIALKAMLTGAGSLTTVDGSTHPKANYWGNPVNGGAGDEPYAYLNLFISGGVSATKIVISGGGFEFDNLVTAESDQNPTASMVYVTSSSGIAPSTQTITWSPSNTTQEVGNSPATPNALASVTTPSSGGGAISYSIASAGTSGCTVNSSTGVISHTSAGTCVVRASAAAVSGATNYFAATKDVSFVFTASPPSTPGTPTAVAGDASATVTAVAAGAGPTPTSYTVTASPGSASCTITLPVTSCVVTGLTNGTSYTFTTTATNGNGTSSASTSSSAVTPTAPAPSSNSQPYIPPAPAPIASVTLSKGTKSTSSNVKVRIKETVSNSLTTDVKVKLVDFTGKVIKEIVVPVENTTQTVEFAVDLPYGDFNVEAVAANRYMTSQSVYSSADLVQKNFFEVKSPNRAPVLAGDVLGKPIYFAANSAKLTKAAKTALAELATALRQSDSRVALTGFASKWNKSKTFEQSLATKRSFAVGNYLKSLGVTNWVYYAGYGALTSVDSLPSARKVELRIVK